MNKFIDWLQWTVYCGYLTLCAFAISEVYLHFIKPLMEL